MNPLKQSKRLRRSFFNRDCILVAQQLIGKTLVFKEKNGIITETEAYKGFDDPASHAYIGKTKRTELMFGSAGFSYIYLIYGKYYCINFVTEKKGCPSAVLIRGLLIQNKKIQNAQIQNSTKENPKIQKSQKKNLCTHKSIVLNGPGKVCQYLGLTKAQNGLDIITDPDLYIVDDKNKFKYKTTSRIGISKGKDKLWRFVVEEYVNHSI